MKLLKMLKIHMYNLLIIIILTFYLFIYNFINEILIDKN